MNLPLISFFFFHSSVDRHLCHLVLAIISKIVWTFVYVFVWEHTFASFINVWNGMAGSYCRYAVFNFQEVDQLCFQKCAIYIPNSSIWQFSLVISYFKVDSRSFKFFYEMAYKCNFNSISQVSIMMYSIFVCIFTILYIFFGEVYIQIFCPYSTSCFSHYRVVFV